MSELDPLIVDFLDWLASEPRSRAEVLDAWRTSCPRLTVWEDAVDRGLASRMTSPGGECVIVATEAGRVFLRERHSGVQA